MKRSADSKLFDHSRSRFHGCADSFLHTGVASTDNHLSRRIIIGWHHSAGGVTAELLHFAVFETDYRRHCAGSVVPGFLHQFSAQLDQHQGFLKCKATGYYQGTVFTQAMASGKPG